MLLKKEREKLIEYGLKLIKVGLTNGTSGNLSIYNREKKLIAITPTGISYHDLVIEDISIVDLSGNVIDGKNPSSEIEMHSILYRRRQDIDAVIHAHTKYSTTIGCLRQDLPAIDYMIAVAGGNNVRCAEYATYGSNELAENAFAAMEDRKAVILANHGITTGAKDIENAFNILEQIEYISELYINAKSIGDPVILDDLEMEKMIVKFKNYGQV